MQFDRMNRRSFITLLGGAAATWPLAARAQQPSMPVIGFLHGASLEGYAPMVNALRQGLSESGYAEGRNVAIEYRWAEGKYDRLPALAAELVQRQVAVIVTGGTPPAFAAKAATTVVPIVFVVGSDPVKLGLVASLNRPGGNVTGVALLTVELAPKRLELLHELLPTATAVAMLVNPTTPLTEPETRGVRDAAHSLGLQLHVLNASTESEIDQAFRRLVELRAGALVVSVELFLNNQRSQIVALAERYKVPAIYGVREFAVAGGLMSYGNDLADAYRQSGIYAANLLKGAKPTDLPVQQVVRVEFIINLKTARALGLTFPITLLGRADEVIE
jgi:putative tryptophan/tyrosine transport system substrate-binding protein